ncbi:MAG: hypothetical protein KGI73_03755 [Patescibacteria group bacterium]|nr:hypothetical protein [Patescibacteria group bacterium]
MARLFLTLVIFCGIVGIAWYAFERVAPNATPPTGSSTVVSNVFSYNNTSADTIFVSTPKPGSGTTEHIIINGFARGPWFTGEGTFPVIVMSADNVVIGSGQAHAGGDWTISSFVPFVADMTLQSAYSGQVVVVLKNGAGNASLSFPLSFN